MTSLLTMLRKWLYNHVIEYTQQNKGLSVHHLRYRVLLGLIFGALVFGLLPGVKAQDTTVQVHSPSGSVDLLQAPTTHTRAIRSLPNDTEVIILAVYANGSWYRVQLIDENITGWIPAEFLVDPTLETPTPSLTITVNNLVALGKLRFEQQQYDEAFDLFTQAIEFGMSNETARAYEARGSIYVLRGQYQLAIEDYSHAIELLPSSVLYFERGSTYIYLSQLDQAVLDLDQAIALMDPDNDTYYLARGLSYLALENYGVAIDDFNSAIAINPDNIDAYYGRGMSFMFQEEWMQALFDFSFVIDANPDYADPYAWRGSIYQKIGGSTEQIRADFCRYVQLAGENARSYVLAEIRLNGWQCDASLRNGADVAFG